MVNDGHLGQGKAYVTRPYSAVLGGLGRFGPLYRRIFLTIDYEGLYDGAIGIPTREIARAFILYILIRLIYLARY